MVTAKSPPKSTDGDLVMNLTPLTKWILVGAFGFLGTVLSATYFKVQESDTKLEVMAVRLENLEEKLQSNHADYAELKEQVRSIRTCVDHHMVSEGHIIMIRRVKALEDVVKDKND
jgi:hypothetical protein